MAPYCYICKKENDKQLSSIGDSSKNDSDSDNDDRRLTKREVKQGDDGDANVDDVAGDDDFEDESEHSWRSDVDTDDDFSDEDLTELPSIQPYAGHRSHSKGYRPKHHTKISKKMVKLPSGDFELISTPSVSRWKCSTKTKLITLNPHGRLGKKEFQIVAEQMDKTKLDLDDCANRGGCYGSFRIVKVQKLVNGCLWNRYRDAKHYIEREDGDANEQMLFHGSTKIWQIINKGLDERFAKKSGVYGAGIYFAHNSSGSNEFSFGYVGRSGCKRHNDKSCHKCLRRILLCRVTLGKYYELDGGGTFFAHAPAGYHSVGGKATPKMYKEYVVYRGEQAYPEYLITYKTHP